MKRILESLLAASLLVSVAAPLYAEDTAEKSATAEKSESQDGAKKRERPKLSPEERAKRLEKAKARGEARLKELKEKQAAGKLSDEESKELDRLSKRLDRAHNHGEKKEKGEKSEAETK